MKSKILLEELYEQVEIDELDTELVGGIDMKKLCSLHAAQCIIDSMYGYDYGSCDFISEYC